MALVLCATQAWGVIQDSAGNARRHLPVEFDVPVYADAEGTTPIAEPETDSKGRIPGYVEAGVRAVTYDGETFEVHAVSAAEVADLAVRLPTAERAAVRAQGRQLVPIADRAAPPFSTGAGLLSDGNATGGTARVRHTAIQTCHGVVLVYSNWYNQAGAETDGPQDLTIAASIEPATTKLVRVTFNGQPTVTIKPGFTVQSDPIGVSLVKGQKFYTRTFLNVAAAATKFPYGGYLTDAAAGEGVSYGVGGTDLTAPGSAAPPAAGVRSFGPSAILGQPTSPGASVVGIVGDSIAAGTGDSGSPGVDMGMIVRALFPNYAYQSVAMPSELYNSWYVQEGLSKSRQQALLERVGLTDVICELGVNGIAAGYDLWRNQVLGTGTKGPWSCLAAFGIPVWQTTITPQTTSTDGWTTVGNQSLANPAAETARLQVNTWLRDGAPITAAPAAGGVPAAVGATGVLRAGDAGHPLAGVLEVADLAESARGSGRWKAGYTSDGTHPNATGAAALAAAFNPDALGLVVST